MLVCLASIILQVFIEFGCDGQLSDTSLHVHCIDGQLSDTSLHVHCIDGQLSDTSLHVHCIDGQLSDTSYIHFFVFTVYVD